MRTGELTCLSTPAVVFSFEPEGSPKSGAAKVGGLTKACTIFLLFTSSIIVSTAQTFKTLVSFDGTNGAIPSGSLVQGNDGSLYGVTLEGGPADAGTVFKITPQGVLTMLHRFCTQHGCPDGDQPFGGMVQASDGQFYGTTAGSPSTVFKITSKGKLTTLSRNLNGPNGALIQAKDGSFYGTAAHGGMYGWGIVFKMSPEGKLVVLHSFNEQDGALPGSGLVEASDGNFYGTTESGGGPGRGTVFKMTPGGKLTRLHSFNYTDGGDPLAGLIQLPNQDFYGTTAGGGANGHGTIFSITSTGKVTTLHSFDGADGSGPVGRLLRATNGILYGITWRGGAHLQGTVFSFAEGQDSSNQSPRPR